jgi:tRNA (guanine10-N2)-dimethyltransferase
LVNLTSVKTGEILIDPFCGTGGILIEAGLVGARIIGSDVEEKMILGCKKNLDHYDISDYELFRSDIGKIDQHINTVDAIATDLPYGKSTTTKGEIMETLYERAFSSMSKILKKGKKAVIGLSEKKFLKIGENHLKLNEIQEVRVHGSLTRYFGIYKK